MSRSSNGYRGYDPAEVQRLGFIRSAQAVGMSLAEIRTILQVRDAGEAPCDHVLGLVNQHRAATEALPPRPGSASCRPSAPNSTDSPSRQRHSTQVDARPARSAI